MSKVVGTACGGGSGSHSGRTSPRCRGPRTRPAVAHRGTDSVPKVRDLPFQELVQDFSDMRIFSFVGTGMSEWLDDAW